MNIKFIVGVLIAMLVFVLKLPGCTSDQEKANKLAAEFQQCVDKEGRPGLIKVNGSAAAVCT